AKSHTVNGVGLAGTSEGAFPTMEPRRKEESMKAREPREEEHTRPFKSSATLVPYRVPVLDTMTCPVPTRWSTNGGPIQVSQPASVRREAEPSPARHRHGARFARRRGCFFLQQTA